MNIDTFESAKRFDEGLRKIDGTGPLHISLGNAWLMCTRHPSGNHLWPAVLDMHLHVARLNVESVSIAKRINNDIHGEKEKDFLADNGELAERLDLFGATTSFVLRYRAIWDKLMGVVILLLEPDKYQKFVKSSSRKKKFVKILNERGGQWPVYALHVSETIKIFDERFRTAEAHGSGRLRKLTFCRASADSNPLVDLFWACNSLNDQLIALKQVFDKFAELPNSVNSK
jgi:hypothetical protein